MPCGLARPPRTDPANPLLVSVCLGLLSPARNGQGIGDFFVKAGRKLAVLEVKQQASVVIVNPGGQENHGGHLLESEAPNTDYFPAGPLSLPGSASEAGSSCN